MLKVNGLELGFDITAPEDLHRYLDAAKAMDDAAAAAPPLPRAEVLATRDGLQEYTAYIEGQCKLLTDFVDAAFGNGTCNALLGPKTSLEGLMDVVDTLREAVAAQGQQAGERIAAYMPNRATHEEK